VSRAVTRRLTGLAATALLIATALPFGATSAAAAPSSDAVTLTVTGIDHATPARSHTLDPLTISLSLQNNTAVAISPRHDHGHTRHADLRPEVARRGHRPTRWHPIMHFHM